MSRRLLDLERSEPRAERATGKAAGVMGATSARALQAVIRTVSPESPHKLLSEDFNLACSELEERMASLPQLAAGIENWTSGARQWLLPSHEGSQLGSRLRSQHSAVVPAHLRIPALHTGSPKALTSQQLLNAIMGAPGDGVNLSQWS